MYFIWVFLIGCNNDYFQHCLLKYLVVASVSMLSGHCVTITFSYENLFTCCDFYFDVLFLITKNQPKLNKNDILMMGLNDVGSVLHV